MSKLGLAAPHSIVMGDATMKKKKPAFTIRYIPVEGDVDEVIDEIVREKVNSVLRKHGAIQYNEKKQPRDRGNV